MFQPDVTVVGGGLAGCEAAWQLAQRELNVALIEMKPAQLSPAHQTPLLCELVCTNSLRADDPATPAGMLKRELRGAGSLVMDCAERHRVPAGQALAVERFGFGRAVTTRLALHPRVRIERRVIDDLPDGPTIVATGPLTGGALGDRLQALCGERRMYFYDAIAPIVAADSIDPERSFRASRWSVDSPRTPHPALPPQAGGGGSCEALDEAGDYINCPLAEAEYLAFVQALLAGRKVVPHPFEEARYFEGCLPVEVMAERGLDVLRHGPMRPVGLVDPRTGMRPHAVVQLRPENRWLTSYNLVGFQTRLAYPEQARIFKLIPALADADFLRFGSIHRNTYLDAPALLGAELELRARPHIRIGGLLTGVEGYIESCAMGLLAALFQAARLRGQALPPPPPTTALGGLYHHVTASRAPGQRFAPTSINIGLLPEVSGKVPKRDRKQRIAERAAADFDAWWAGAAARAA